MCQSLHNATGHETPFTMTPILHLNHNDRIYRKEMEQFLIKKFKPELNWE